MGKGTSGEDFFLMADSEPHLKSYEGDEFLTANVIFLIIIPATLRAEKWKA